MIWLILILGFILRLINLNQSLWLDEAINVVAAKNYGIKDLITKYALGDFHPPLFHPFLWIWIRIFGDSEISVRIPSVIFGVLTIYFTYLLGKELINKKFGLLSAFLITIAPYNIYFSQEARMYALEGLLGTVSIYFFLKILKKDNLYAWIGYTVFSTLAIYIDYFGFFLPLIPFLYILINKRSNLFKKWLISIFVIFLSWLPWLPFFLVQFNNAQRTAKVIPGWTKVVGNVSIKNLALTFIKFSIGRISFENKFVYGFLAVFIFCIFSILIYRGLKRIGKENRLIVIIWLLVPLITSSLISLVVPIYQPFRLLYLLPAFYILLSAGIFSFTKTWQKILSGLFVFFISFTGLMIYYFNPQFQRENWREAVRILEARADETDLVIFTSFEPMSPYVYYLKKNLKLLGKNGSKELIKSKRIFLFRYLWPVYDPSDSLKKEIEVSFNLIDVKDFNGVVWQEYQRKY